MPFHYAVWVGMLYYRDVWESENPTLTPSVLLRALPSPSCSLFPLFSLSLLPFTWEVRARLALSALGFKKIFPCAHKVNIRQIWGGGRMLTQSKEVLMLQLTEVSLNLSSCCYKLNMFLSQDVPTPFTSGTKWRGGADILDLFLFGREKKKLKNDI